MQHADGEMLAARAAEEFGVPFTLSTMSICSIEDVASVRTRPFSFQLYVMRDREFVASLIDRAKAAGCSALVLTLDLQILGQRHKDLRNGLSAPPKLTLAEHPRYGDAGEMGLGHAPDPTAIGSETSSAMPRMSTISPRSRPGPTNSSIRSCRGTALEWIRKRGTVR